MPLQVEYRLKCNDNMNKNKILFFLFIVIEMLVALLLEFVSDSNGPLLGNIDNGAQIQYIFGMITALSVILSAFLAIKKKQLNPIVRMAVVISGVNMVLFDYYFFYDSNLLYCLFVLGIAYLFIWPSLDNQETEV